MARIPIENLREGFLVQADVENLHGQVLFRSGTVLTDKLISRLRAWGVADVDVELDDDDDRAENERLLLKIQEEEVRIGELFVFSDTQHPTVRMLIRYGAERAIRHREPVEQESP